MPKSVHRAVVYPVRRSVRLRPGKALPVKPSPAPIHSTATYDFPEEKSYFFDTNIWLYIYGPIGWPDQKSAVYSRALREIRNSNGTIYINCMVISEFINAFSRIEFKQQTDHSRFKEFRNSLSFRPVAEDISFQRRTPRRPCEAEMFLHSPPAGIAQIGRRPILRPPRHQGTPFLRCRQTTAQTLRQDSRGAGWNVLGGMIRRGRSGRRRPVRVDLPRPFRERCSSPPPRAQPQASVPNQPSPRSRARVIFGRTAARHIG